MESIALSHFITVGGQYVGIRITREALDRIAGEPGLSACKMINDHGDALDAHCIALVNDGEPGDDGGYILTADQVWKQEEGLVVTEPPLLRIVTDPVRVLD